MGVPIAAAAQFYTFAGQTGDFTLTVGGLIAGALPVIGGADGMSGPARPTLMNARRPGKEPDQQREIFTSLVSALDTPAMPKSRAWLCSRNWRKNRSERKGIILDGRLATWQTDNLNSKG